MKSRTIIVCSNGTKYEATSSLSTNSWTFIHMNKGVMTTFDVYKRAMQNYQNSLKRVQTSYNMRNLAL